MIEKYDVQILFLWGPGEYQFVHLVKQKMKHTSLPDYDVPTILETMAILEKVDMHIGNDNGPMHFAIAAGVPTVAIFGKPMMKNWMPPKSMKHQAVEYDPGCKNNCFYPKCQLECLKKVTIEKVIEKIEYLVSTLNCL